MSKQKSMGMGNFAKGGSGKMSGQNAAVPQSAGTSSPTQGSAGAGGKFAKGGTTKMFGPQKVKPAEPGCC